MTTHYRHEVAKVEFSRDATAVTSFDEVYSAFTRNSYIARVTFFDDSRSVCVCLPVGAAKMREQGWVDRAIEAAQDLPDGGIAFL